MPRSRSRSRSRSPPPRRRSDSHRDRSPPHRAKPRIERGFKWKDKKPREQDDNEGNAPDRSGRRPEHYRPQRYDRDHDRDRERNPARQHRDSPTTAATSTPSDKPQPQQQQQKQTSTSAPKNKKPQPPAPPSQPMIRVTVNDRLGTKSQIPCLPSDTVGDFKKLVAAQIGRKPHEIMLKRQSERPFKDVLTLEDYGVSDGVQLDLELDTGD